MRARLRHLLHAVLALIAIVSLSTAWALNSPIGAGPDEPTHVVHAWGVVTGQTLPANESLTVDENGAYLTKITMPASLLEYQELKCYLSKLSRTPSCGLVEENPPDSEQTTAYSYMTRYPPMYYAGAGVVIRGALAAGASGHEAMVATRIASGAACLLMILLAAALLKRRFGGPGPALLVLAGLTPVSLSLFSNVNPNGLEIASAVLSAAFVCVLRENYRHSPRAHPWLLVGFVLSLAILTWSRPLSLVWAGLLLGLLLLPGGVLPALRRKAPELAAVALSILSLAGAAAWVLYSTATRTMGGQSAGDLWAGFSLPVKMVLASLKFGGLFQQMVGLMGSDTQLPLLLVGTWCLLTAMIVCVLATGALRAATSLRHVTLFALGSAAAVGGYTVLAAFGWQGRYWLPAVAAALVLCVPSLQGRHLTVHASKRLALSATALFLGMQAFGFLWHLWRYVYGVNSFYPRFDPIPGPFLRVGWIPPLGQPVIFMLFLLGTGALGVFLLLGSWRRPAEAVASPGEAVGPKAGVTPTARDILESRLIPESSGTRKWSATDEQGSSPRPGESPGPGELPGADAQGTPEPGVSQTPGESPTRAPR